MAENLADNLYNIVKNLAPCASTLQGKTFESTNLRHVCPNIATRNIWGDVQNFEAGFVLALFFS